MRRSMTPRTAGIRMRTSSPYQPQFGGAGNGRLVFLHRLPLDHALVDGHDVPRQADLLQGPDRDPGDVQFPPLVPVCRRPRLSVVVVVPALAVAHEADEDVVAAVLVGLVVAV